MPVHLEKQAHPPRATKSAATQAIRADAPKSRKPQSDAATVLSASDAVRQPVGAATKRSRDHTERDNSEPPTQRIRTGKRFVQRAPAPPSTVAETSPAAQLAPPNQAITPSEISSTISSSPIFFQKYGLQGTSSTYDPPLAQPRSGIALSYDPPPAQPRSGITSTNLPPPTPGNGMPIPSSLSSSTGRFSSPVAPIRTPSTRSAFSHRQSSFSPAPSSNDSVVHHSEVIVLSKHTSRSIYSVGDIVLSAVVAATIVHFTKILVRESPFLGSEDVPKVSNTLPGMIYLAK